MLPPAPPPGRKGLCALAVHKDGYEDVELLRLVMPGTGAAAAPGREGRFHHNVIFAGSAARKAIETEKSLKPALRCTEGRGRGGCFMRKGGTL